MRTRKSLSIVSFASATLLILWSITRLVSHGSVESPGWEYTLGMQLAALFLAMGWILDVSRLTARERARSKQAADREAELARLIEEAAQQVKVLNGMLPICASCKKIRDNNGHWRQLESYIHEHSEAEFSHGICPDCFGSLYPDYARAKADLSATPRIDSQA